MAMTLFPSLSFLNPHDLFSSQEFSRMESQSQSQILIHTSLTFYEYSTL